jgi:hypothetical protein
VARKARRAAGDADAARRVRVAAQLARRPARRHARRENSTRAAQKGHAKSRGLPGQPPIRRPAPEPKWVLQAKEARACTPVAPARKAEVATLAIRASTVARVLDYWAAEDAARNASRNRQIPGGPPAGRYRDRGRAARLARRAPPRRWTSASTFTRCRGRCPSAPSNPGGRAVLSFQA